MDIFGRFARGLSEPARSAFSVTPNDSVDVSYVTRGLYVGATGDIKVTMADGDTVTLNSIAAGIVHPLRVSRVWSTGTTATGIVGIY